jgi:hypothetical protein
VFPSNVIAGFFKFQSHDLFNVPESRGRADT